MGSISSVVTQKADQDFPYFCILFRGSSELITVHCNKDTDALLKKCLSNWKEDGVRSKLAKRIAKCYDLKDHPFKDLYSYYSAEKRGIAVKNLICSLLSDLYVAGWRLGVCTDFSTNEDTSSWYFETSGVKEDEDTKIRTVCVSAGESNKLQLVNITDGARSAVRKSLKKWVGEEKIKNDLCEIILKGKPWRQENTEEVNTSRRIMLRVIGALHNAGFPFYGSFGAKEQIDTLFFQERELPENEESFFMISLHGRNKLRLFEVEDELADALKEFFVKTWQDGIDRFRTHEKEGYTEIKLAGGLWLDDSGRMVLNRVFEWMADKGWALYCSFEVAPYVSEKCCLVFRKTESAKATFICIYPVYDNKIHICGASGKLKDQIVENITKHWPTISDKGWIQQGENQYAVSDIFQVTLLGNPWAGRDRDQSLMARHLMMAIMIELQGLGLTLAASASLMCFEGSDPESDEAVTLDALFFTDYSDKLDFNQQERATKWAEALPEPKHFTEEEADAAMANYLLQKELR